MAGMCYPSLMECQLCLLDQREETGSLHIAREKEEYIPIVGRVHKYILCHPKVEVTYPYRSPQPTSRPHSPTFSSWHQTMSAVLLCQTMIHLPLHTMMT